MIPISDETYELIREPKTYTVTAKMFTEVSNLSRSHVPNTNTSEVQLQSCIQKYATVSHDSEDREDVGRSSTGSDDTYDKIDEDKHTSNLTHQANRCERTLGREDHDESRKEHLDISSTLVIDYIASSLQTGNVAIGEDEMTGESGYLMPNKQTTSREIPLVPVSPCIGEDGYKVPDVEVGSLETDLAARSGILNLQSSTAEIQEHNGTSQTEAVSYQLQGIGKNVTWVGLPSDNIQPVQWSHNLGIHYLDFDKENDTQDGSGGVDIDEFGYLILDSKVKTSHEKLVPGQEEVVPRADDLCSGSMVSFNDTDGTSIIGEAGYVAQNDKGRDKNSLSQFSAELAVHRNRGVMRPSLAVEANPTTDGDTPFLQHTYLSPDDLTCELSNDDTDEFKHEPQVGCQQNIVRKDAENSAIADMTDKTTYLNTRANKHSYFAPNRILEKEDDDRDNSVAVYQNASRMRAPKMRLVARADIRNAQETVSLDMETFARNQRSQSLKEINHGDTAAEGPDQEEEVTYYDEIK